MWFKQIALIAVMGMFVGGAAHTTRSSVPPPHLFLPPLTRAAERITKKFFGTFVTPQHSPVTPERFRGYHTGIDFETFADEQKIPVPVSVICSGPLILKKWVRGYGGVAVQKCILRGQTITVVYGHLQLASIAAARGVKLIAGQQLGVLGKGFSVETDGERKHLHLGIHKGAGVDVRGYVQKKSELAHWVDGAWY